MNLADLDPKAQAALVFNEGLVAREVDARGMAEQLLEKSLHMRPQNDPGRREVMKELETIGASER
jgi:Tfp pilus assembly protein PilF